MCLQISKIFANLTALRDEHNALATKRNTLEHAYRVSAIDECDMDEKDAQNKIAQARSTPQKNKRLQSIYKIHKQVLLKETEIAGVEGELAAARETQSSTKVTKECQDHSRCYLPPRAHLYSAVLVK